MGVLPKQARTLGRVGENSLFFTSDQKHFNMPSVGEISNSEKVLWKSERSSWKISAMCGGCTWEGMVRIGQGEQVNKVASVRQHWNATSGITCFITLDFQIESCSDLCAYFPQVQVSGFSRIFTAAKPWVESCWISGKAAGCRGVDVVFPAEKIWVCLWFWADKRGCCLGVCPATGRGHRSTGALSFLSSAWV